MSRFSILFIFLLSAPVMAIFEVKELKPYRPREIELKLSNRNEELLKAIFHGSTAITLGIATGYALSRALMRFTSDAPSNDSFWGWLDIIMALTVLKLAWQDANSCIESLKKAFSGYTITTQKTE
jgi:hypothetical protein